MKNKLIAICRRWWRKLPPGIRNAALRLNIVPAKLRIEFFSRLGRNGLPTIVGWISNRNLEVRAKVGEQIFDAQMRPRAEKWLHGFFIEFPTSLRQAKNFIHIQYKSGNSSWKTAASLAQRKKRTTPKIAILIHAHYPNVLMHLLSQCRQALPHADIFLHRTENNPVDQSWSMSTLKSFRIRDSTRGKPTGRDGAGQLRNLERVYASKQHYDYCLFLHTKRSPQFPETASQQWLQLLVDPLLGSGLLDMDNIVKLMEDPDIGMMGSAPCLSSKDESNNINFGRYRQICNLLGVPAIKRPQFVAGAMFWINSSILSRYLDAAKIAAILPLFESNDKTEPTMAHALERVWGALIAANQQYLLPLPMPLSHDLHYHS